MSLDDGLVQYVFLDGKAKELRTKIWTSTSLWRKTSLSFQCL